MHKKNFKFYLITLLIFLSGSFYPQRINPGDGIRITFLDITDPISGDYYVQPDGKIQLPYAGIVNTSGKDFSIIKSEILARYDSLYKNPDLTVLALFRINVHGEVRNPGFYYVTEVEKLSGIIALAGGYTSAANLDGLFIYRGAEEIELDVATMIAGGETVSAIGLQSGDQIVVPRSFWADPARFTWAFSLIALLLTAVALFVN